MNAEEMAGGLRREVSGRDTILCPGPGHSPRVSVKFHRSPAIGRPRIAITHQRNRHGATSLAVVAKGVCLHHERYLTS